MNKYRVTLTVTLRYRGESVTLPPSTVDVEASWEGEARDSATFIWEEGNFSCDCNRSLMARQAGMEWPELDCSSEQIEADLDTRVVERT